MNYYDILRILSITEACKDRTRALLTSPIMFDDSQMAVLCSYYISLHDLGKVLKNYLTNEQVDGKKISDKEFLTKVVMYIQLSSKFEEEANTFASFEIH